MREASRFFEGRSAVHVTLTRIVANLDRLGIVYAVCGGMALNAHGYRRCTIDVDIIVADVARVRAELLNCGYEPAATASVRDTATAVRVDFIAGEPAVSQRVNGVCYVTLAALVDAKLSVGKKPGRLKHLGDVQEMIKHVPLPRELSARLNPAIAGTYLEYWDVIAATPRELW